nr:hypothetical protein [Psittacine picornavirus]
MISTTPKADLGRIKAQMQDLRGLIAQVDNSLGEEMELNELRVKLIDHLNAEIQTLHQATDVLENTVHTLEAQLAERDALIAELQAPPPPPSLPQELAEEDGAPQFEESEPKEEEEDPVPTVYIHTDGEETVDVGLDTPAKNTRSKKRKSMTARQYFALYKRS